MARDWDEDYKTERQTVNPEPVVLLDIVTGITGTTHIWLTSNETDYTWDSITWTARPFEGGSFSIQAGESGEVDITLGDADGYFGTWLLSTDFRNEKVTRYVVERDENDVVTGVQKDVWRVSNTSRSDRMFTFKVEFLQALLGRIKVPMQLLTKDKYPGIPDERSSF